MEMKPMSCNAAVVACGALSAAGARWFPVTLRLSPRPEYPADPADSRLGLNRAGHDASLLAEREEEPE